MFIVKNKFVSPNVYDGLTISISDIVSCVPVMMLQQDYLIGINGFECSLQGFIFQGGGRRGGGRYVWWGQNMGGKNMNNKKSYELEAKI